MSHSNRSVEHYRDHELVCEISLGDGGWSYRISVVTHQGDESEARSEQSSQGYATDLEALQAGSARARELVDQLADG